MLSIMVLSWREMLSEHLSPLDSLATRRRLLFETYIAQMFEGKGEGNKPCHDDQAKYWLTWLARQMSHHNQTIFLIEQMQPSWLPSTIWQWAYIFISRMLTALLLEMGILSVSCRIGLWPTRGTHLRFYRWLKRFANGWPHLRSDGYYSGCAFGGLSQDIIEKKSFPNQGIYSSLRNALFSGLIFGLMGGVAFSIVQGLSLALYSRATLSVAIMSRGAGPIFAGLSVATLTALCYGGQDVINHLILRVLLAIKGYVPGNYAHFLDYAANLIFLRKVGGGYVFIHRLLLEYFASLKPDK